MSQEKQGRRPKGDPPARLTAPRGFRWSRLIGLLAAVVALVLIGLAARDMLSPVSRPGRPTVAVPPPTATSAPKASPSAEPSASPSRTKSTSAKPSKTPSSTKPPADKNFSTSSVAIPAESSSGKLHSLVIKVENKTGLKANSLARRVMDVLNDPRSWTGSGRVRFAVVKSEKDAEFTITLASAKSMAGLCVDGQDEAPWTCRKGKQLIINADAWNQAPSSFPGDQTAYQRFLINHEVGHYLGKTHEKCPGKGKPAPVMMQQSTGVGKCRANPWPTP